MRRTLLFLLSLILSIQSLDIECLVFTASKGNDLNQAYQSTKVNPLCQGVRMFVNLDTLIGSKVNGTGKITLISINGNSSLSFEFGGFDSIQIDGFNLYGNFEPMKFQSVGSVHILDSKFEGGINGAISVFNSPHSNVSVIASSFIRNLGKGAINIDSADNFEVRDCNFEMNEGENGGAIRSGASQTFLTTSSFSYNIASNRGDAVFSESGSQELRLENCTFEGKESEIFVVCLSQICPNITGQTELEVHSTSSSLLTDPTPSSSIEKESFSSYLSDSTERFTYGNDSALGGTGKARSGASFIHLPCILTFVLAFSL